MCTHVRMLTAYFSQENKLEQHVNKFTVKLQTLMFGFRADQNCREPIDNKILAFLLGLG